MWFCPIASGVSAIFFKIQLLKVQYWGRDWGELILKILRSIWTREVRDLSGISTSGVDALCEARVGLRRSLTSFETESLGIQGNLVPRSENFKKRTEGDLASFV